MIQYRIFLILVLVVVSLKSEAQKVYGKVTNTKMEPLAFVSVEVKGRNSGTMSNEEGNYSLNLEEGKYDLVFSMVGYESQLVPLVIDKNGTVKNIILEEDALNALSTVVIKKKMKDPAEEIIRNVIRHKNEIMAASGAYSCTLYIKAIQEDSLSAEKSKWNKKDTIEDVNKDLRQMQMAEIALHLDYESLDRMKEERIGVTKVRRFSGLFYLSATDGDFNFYNNLLKVPSVSEIPILSPVSYSGLIAYKFKTKEIRKEGARKIYVISVKPGRLSNATVEGEITIEDSSWVILHTKFSFPKYHLPEYDFFEVEQDYQFVNNEAWMISRQQFTYFSKAGKRKVSGRTTVSYKDFELNKIFDKKHFGVEVSATEQFAYERDSAFWQTVRTEPLSQKEIRYIRYKDSIYAATHTREYLDSVDRIINKITWKKVVFQGITYSNHERGSNWYFGTLPSIFQPFQFGGSRLGLFFNYSKMYKSKKYISLWNNLSYGIRNQDVNGTIRFSKLYNPFKRSYYNITLERNFEFIFQGDAWINMLKRSNYYLKNGIGIGHNFEVANGLYLFTDMNVAFRRSVSNYKTNDLVDSLFGGVLENNQAVSFQPYNATYG